MSLKMMGLMLWNWLQGKRMKNCKEVVDLLSDYIADELPPEDTAGIRAHLQGCQNCTAFLDSLRTTIKLTHNLGVEDIPPEVVDRLQNYLKSRMGANNSAAPGKEQEEL